MNLATSLAASPSLVLLNDQGGLAKLGGGAIPSVAHRARGNAPRLVTQTTPSRTSVVRPLKVYPPTSPALLAAGLYPLFSASSKASSPPPSLSGVSWASSAARVASGAPSESRQTKLSQFGRAGVSVPADIPFNAGGRYTAAAEARLDRALPVSVDTTPALSQRTPPARRRVLRWMGDPR